MAQTDLLLGRAHTARVMPSKEQQRLRHLLMAIGGVVLVFLTFKYLQMSQQIEFVGAARAGNVPAVRAAL